MLCTEQTQAHLSLSIMASNTTDDLFAGMKKKSKKSSKKATFDELDLDAPSAAAAVESAPADAPAPSSAQADEDTSASAPAATDDLDFSDLKKKKKSKKTVRIASDDELEDDQPHTPAPRKTDALGNEVIEDAAPPSAMAGASGSSSGDILDEFADLKKKKKKSSKKANYDLEAFEKELAATEAAEQQDSAPVSKSGTPAGSDDEDGDVAAEPVEGEDPFGGEAEESTLSKAEAAAEAKAWLKEGDRDYHYTEVGFEYEAPDKSNLLTLILGLIAAFGSILLSAVPVSSIVVWWRRQEEVHDPTSAIVP